MIAVRAIRLLVVMSVKVAPWQAAACLCETAGVIVGLFQPLYLSWIFAAVIDHNRDHLLSAGVLFLITFFAMRLLFVIGMNARAGQLERVGYAFDTRIAETTASIRAIEHFDDPAFLDQLQILHEQQGALGLAVNTLLNTLNTLIGTVGVILLAAGADWRMLLVAAAGAPGVLATPLVSKWQGRAEQASAEPGRLAYELLQTGTTAGAAGEIRVFGLGDPMRSRLAAATRAWRAPRISLARRESVVAAASQFTFYAVAGTILVWLVSETLERQLPIAALTLALLLTNQLQMVSVNLRDVVTNIATMSRTAGRFLWLLDTEQDIRCRNDYTHEAPAANRISLRGLTYRYPGASTAALSDVTLDLSAGSVVAIVGENGAGKSTLVELLAGLRVPTHGCIAIGDVALGRVDPFRWWTRLAGAFQDFVRFELTAGDTVGIGDLSARANRREITRAIRDGAAEQVVAALPAGLDTHLGASWPGGIGLSGGQWQRLAIARGMMRRAPTIRILDEPTAALDAATEHELLERYAAAARDGRATGVVTVLVTHRFSTVASADFVVVLHHGRLIETGTHAELIARGGHYAQLYELQAHGYR